MEKPPNREEREHASSPAVHFIVQTLEQRIRVGHYSVGQRLPTERALAEELASLKRARWREENRGAIAAYNEFVDEHGTFSDGVRSF